MNAEIADPRLRLKEARDLHAQAKAAEHEAVRHALRLVGGNVRQAADLLEMPHRTLDSWIRGGRLSELKSEVSGKPGRPPKLSAAKLPPLPKAASYAKDQRRALRKPKTEQPWIAAGFKSRSEYREHKKKLAK